MEDNRRTTHSVDDYYPKPTAQIPLVLMRMLPMKTAALVFPITVATRILTARAATALRSMQVGR